MANADVFAAMSQKSKGPTTKEVWGVDASGKYEPSSTDIWGEVENKPTTTTGALQAKPAEPAEVKRSKGSGGYEYAEMSDGTIQITKSPRGGEGTMVAQDSPFYDLIKADISKFMAPGAKPAAKPAAAKAPAAAPSKAAPAPKASSRETPDEIADRLLTSLDGVPRGEPGPEFGGMGEIRSSETGVPPMPEYEPPASMVGPSEYDKRKELSMYSGGVAGNLKRASLVDAAVKGLVRANLDEKAARATAVQMAANMAKGDYKSLTALKAFAAM